MPLQVWLDRDILRQLYTVMTQQLWCAESSGDEVIWQVIAASFCTVLAPSLLPNVKYGKQEAIAATVSHPELSAR